MDEKTARRDRFEWKLLCLAAVGALIIFAMIVVFRIDVFDMVYIFVVAPIISLTLIVVAVREKGRRRLEVLLMLVAYLAASWGLVKNSLELSTTGRWLLSAKGYKAEVLAQPDSQNGELKHIEWDGWGFAGSDTEVYLVFDPNDSLSTAARSHSPGKFGGIPCPVDGVQRLESHYYTVLFSTGTDWSNCS
jgi:hypothetical protein